jgi:hypothetical protein
VLSCFGEEKVSFSTMPVKEKGSTRVVQVEPAVVT